VKKGHADRAEWTVLNTDVCHVLVLRAPASRRPRIIPLLTQFWLTGPEIVMSPL
jgi:hypothetical protein